MKYKVQLINEKSGEVVDESAELLSAENAIGLIRAWESIMREKLRRPTPATPDRARRCPVCGEIMDLVVLCPICNLV